jgi:hypothetical protein
MEATVKAGVLTLDVRSPPLERPTWTIAKLRDDYEVIEDTALNALFIINLPVSPLGATSRGVFSLALPFLIFDASPRLARVEPLLPAPYL